MKIKALILSILILITGNLSANASQLPKEIKDFLQAQKQVPSVRFDGLVVYNDNVMYIPVFPSTPKDVETLEVVKTYPANKTIDSLPDMVLFNNNYALLKVIRVDQNTLTVKNIPDMPTEIKTGLLPQDMMVPRGLVLPESFAGILGDVEIPLIGSAKTATFITGRKTAPLPNGKRIAESKKYPVPNDLKNKLFFVNNFQTEFLQIFSSSVSEPLYSLKTSGVMKDIKPVLGGKFILAATNNQKNIDVIDVNNEYISKKIALTANPTEIAVDDNNKKAYIASVEDESLFVIDLDSMTMKEKIQLAGAPQRLSVSKDGKKIAYMDMKTSNVYILDLENDYENKLITNYPNITELILDDNVIYMIARTKPKLRIVYFDLLQDNKVTKTKKDLKKEKRQKEEEKNSAETETADVFSGFDFNGPSEDEEELIKNAKVYSTGIKDVEIGTKPVDLVQNGNQIFVLCAGNNTVYTYNTEDSELTNSKLPVDGFSKAFTPVPGSNLAVITNMSDLKYVVYDMAKNKSVQTQPISEYINMITILERNNGQ